jgi:hypothetical protein
MLCAPETLVIARRQEQVLAEAPRRGLDPSERHHRRLMRRATRNDGRVRREASSSGQREDSRSTVDCSASGSAVAGCRAAGCSVSREGFGC